MAVKIRLARRGRKKMAMYDVVIADARSPRDGKFIEKIGTYNPNVNPASIELDNDKAFKWVMDGAQPTDTVRAILSYRGIMIKKHLQIGVNKGAITQEQADAKFDDWVKGKEVEVQGKVDTLTKAKDADKKSRQEAETKVKEARSEALQKKNSDLVAALEAESAEAIKEAATEEAVEAAETVAEEAAPEVVEAPAPEVVEAPAPEVAVAPVEEAAPVVEETPAKEEAAPEAKVEETPAKEAPASEEEKKAE